MTEHLWASGPFADAYMERNIDAGDRRRAFWDRIMLEYPTRSVLEVGSHVGGTLRHLMKLVPDLAGVDLNELALSSARRRGIQADLRVASATRLPFSSATFDLVFTAGVLVHLDDAQLPKAMDEIVRVSRSHILAIEYFAPTATAVPYRGHEAALWKRPFDRLYLERHPELVLRGQGWVGKEDGFDDCTWWMFEKDAADVGPAELFEK